MRLAAFALLTASAMAQDSPLLQAVEPDFGADAKKPMVALPLLMDFVVLPDGTPLTAESRGFGFPDPVARALGKYRFRPTGKSYSVTLPLRVPYLIENYDGTPRIPVMLPTEVFGTSVTLSADKALELENRLKDGDESVRDRYALIIFTSTQKDPRLLALRARQIAWFVKNQPHADVLLTWAGTLSKSVAPEGYAEIRQLWLDTLAKFPGEIGLLEAATNFFRVSDPEEVQRILVPYSRGSASIMAWLGEAYAFAAIGITNLSSTGGPPTSAGLTLPVTPFALSARSTLLLTSDLPLLMSAFSTIGTAANSLMENQAGLPDGLLPFCDEVRARIRELKPNFNANCQFELAPSQEIKPSSVVKQVQPKYPTEASSRGIQGIVDLSATIGADGTLKKVRLLKGPLLLYPAAYEAVQRWKFQPKRINGRAVESPTGLHVQFQLR